MAGIMTILSPFSSIRLSPFSRTRSVTSIVATLIGDVSIEPDTLISEEAIKSTAASEVMVAEPPTIPTPSMLTDEAEIVRPDATISDVALEIIYELESTELDPIISDEAFNSLVLSETIEAEPDILNAP